MDLLPAFILGSVQGLTEFLPVSSSGHLVLGQALLGGDKVEAPLFFTVWVHIGTLFAVLLFYRRDVAALLRLVFSPASWRDPGPPLLDDGQPTGGRALIIALILGTLPAVVLGLLFKDRLEELFGSPRGASAMLLFTAAVLLLSLLDRGGKASITPGRAILIGLAQALALPPGISRSGMTIVAGMLLGLPRAEAVRFSFLMSLPTIGGAIVLMLAKRPDLTGMGPDVLAVSGAASFVLGLVAILLVKRFVEAGKFHVFSPYCAALGLFGLFYFA
jgi:undecaprenyl-diphosphatase